MATSCPRGHVSDEPDYCSVCGTPMGGPVASTSAPAATAPVALPARPPGTSVSAAPRLVSPAGRPVTLTPGALVMSANGASARWPLRRLLRWLTGGLLACTALFLLVSEVALGRERAALQTLGRDTAPSILAAQRIRADLADLDARAADSLLGSGAQREAALAQVERRRSTLVGSLVDAAHNITYGDAERRPIVTLVEGMGRHLELWAKARQWHERGDLERARREQRAATDLLDGTLLTAADALDRANRSHLDEVYATQQAAESAGRLWVLVVGGSLLALLAGTQGLLAARTRRILSAPLLGATLLGAGSLSYVSSTLAASHEALRAAREDAFESIHLLITARALVCDASGDQARGLLDPERAGDYQRAFAAKLAKLSARQTLPPRESKPLAGAAPGLLDRELANITYPGEREAATDALQALALYRSTNASLQQRVSAGDSAGATALRLGHGERESDGAFGRLDEALGRTLAINEHAFEQLLDAGGERLRTAAPIVPFLLLTTGALVALGMRPRLREYR